MKIPVKLLSLSFSLIAVFLFVISIGSVGKANAAADHSPCKISYRHDPSM